MRIGVLHDLGPGGARRRLLGQVAALVELGADVVEVTASGATPVTSRPAAVALRQVAPGLPRALRPPSRHRDLTRLRAAWRQMGELAVASGADVVYANPDRLLRGAVGCGPLGVPVARFVDEPRRIDHEPELARTLNPATRGLYAGLHRREAATDAAGVREAAELLTNSAATAAAIERGYGRSATVLPVGVPAAMTADGPAAQPCLLSVGALLPTKGHRLAVEVAARSGLGLPLVVVAHTASAAEEGRLLALAERHGVALELRIGIGDAELASLYRGAVALLYLAEREPLGLASLEAQACGCPVVVSAEGGLPETVRPGGGLAVPRDAAAAAEAVRAVAAEPRPAGRTTGDDDGRRDGAVRLLALLGRLAGAPEGGIELPRGGGTVVRRAVDLREP